MMEADKSAIIRINLRIAEASRRSVDSAFTPRLFSHSGILNRRNPGLGHIRPNPHKRELKALASNPIDGLR